MSQLTQNEAKAICKEMGINEYMKDQLAIHKMIIENADLHMAYRKLFYIANPKK